MDEKKNKVEERMVEYVGMLYASEEEKNNQSIILKNQDSDMARKGKVKRKGRRKREKKRMKEEKRRKA